MRERKPLALANWKMAMTVEQGRSFLRNIQTAAADLLDRVELVICPPATLLWPLAQDVRHPNISLGAQNMAATLNISRTGEVSAPLLADVGCRYVLLGHWEVRRNLGDDDTTVNAKMHLAFEAGLRPVVLVGEAHDDEASLEEVLNRRLAEVLRGCSASQAASLVCIYEPEQAIGQVSPVTPDHAAAGCSLIRKWVQSTWGGNAGEQIRIIYGGSVTPEHAANLMVCMDGLGASTRGRDASTFAEIMRQIARARGDYC